jgi:putative peptidoglycan lipid II flippase
MFPYIFLIGLVALAMGVLNARKNFSAPALSPVLLNLAIIACTLGISPWLDRPVLGLAVGVLLGGAAQLVFQLPFILRQGIVLRFLFRPSHPGVRRIAGLMAPSILGLAVTQLNVLVNTFLASYLPQGSVSYLYYADRLLEFPMGIFAIAIATAVLPTFSEQAARQDIDGLRETLAFALRLVFFVTIPAMVGLIVLRVPILNLLFQRGAFSGESTAMTAQALLYYSLGLGAFAGVRIIVPAFYSLQDTRTPVKVAVLALVANAGLGAALMTPLRHGGLALGTSLAAAVNFGVLLVLLRRKLGRIGGRKIFHSLLKSLAASGVMGGCVWALTSIDTWQQGGVTLLKVGLLLGSVVGGGVVYGASSYLLGSGEMHALAGALRKRFIRNNL